MQANTFYFVILYSIPNSKYMYYYFSGIQNAHQGHVIQASRQRTSGKTPTMGRGKWVWNQKFRSDKPNAAHTNTHTRQGLRTFRALVNNMLWMCPSYIHRVHYLVICIMFAIFIRNHYLVDRRWPPSQSPCDPRRRCRCRVSFGAIVVVVSRAWAWSGYSVIVLY